MKQLAKAAQVPIDTDTDVLIAALRGQQIVATVDEEKDKNETLADGSPNPYKGRPRNRVRGYYPLGSRTPQVAQQASAMPTPQPRAAPARRTPQAPRAQPVAEQPIAPAQAQTPPAPRVVSPRAAPAARRPPPAAQPPPAQPKAPAKKTSGPKIQCAECKTDYLRSDFANPEVHACSAKGDNRRDE